MLRIVAENVHRVHIAAGVEHQAGVDGTHHLLTALASGRSGRSCLEPRLLLRAKAKAKAKPADKAKAKPAGKPIDLTGGAVLGHKPH
ncbi:hypothetical protein HYH03_018670 [Edaphochlamys debaryana]|uniref:Uncharacterized protein n=1 Tax=Edaphochlamys debaryana TaxID=47281 RepID=A0A835XG34_9CHLO|nr:hypothetical protein HYH03_018670 [Edaphochlamys debaryana]|eukprot:KAG2482392.1 hypothetical protein HYH03_018670 [Edaphochlamys debaryana]